MPADRSPREPARITSPSGGEKLVCPNCKKTFNRTADVNRHMRTHDPNAQKRKCIMPDCTYETFQASNLRTHMNTHNGVKPHKCMDDPANCDFATADPASLTRHRQRRHNYKPPPRKPKGREEKKKVEANVKAQEEEEQEPVEEHVPPAPSQNALAGPSNHVTALEHPPIATLQPAYFSSSESSGSESDSESDSDSDSDSDSVNTDQFYPSSVSSHGYDHFAKLIPVTALPQTPPSSQLPPCPTHGGPDVKFEDDCPVDEPRLLEIFIKGASGLLDVADPTAIGFPIPWIEVKSKTFSSFQNNAPLHVDPLQAAFTKKFTTPTTIGQAFPTYISHTGDSFCRTTPPLLRCCIQLTMGLLHYCHLLVSFASIRGSFIFLCQHHASSDASNS